MSTQGSTVRRTKELEDEKSGRGQAKSLDARPLDLKHGKNQPADPDQVALLKETSDRYVLHPCIKASSRDVRQGDAAISVLFAEQVALAIEQMTRTLAAAMTILTQLTRSFI